METYYQILGLDEQCTQEDITRAYRGRIRKWHPDLNPDKREEATERSKLILQAKQVLIDPVSRADYDGFLKASRESEQRQRPQASGGSRAAEERYETSSDYGRRAAERAAVQVNWGLDELLKGVWSGTEKHREQKTFGTMMAAGFWGWMLVILVGFICSGVVTIPALFFARALWHSATQAFVREGEFVGFGTVLGGMVACVAIPVGGIALLAMIASGNSGSSYRGYSSYSTPPPVTTSSVSATPSFPSVSTTPQYQPTPAPSTYSPPASVAPQVQVNDEQDARKSGGVIGENKPVQPASREPIERSFSTAPVVPPTGNPTQIARQLVQQATASLSVAEQMAGRHREARVPALQRYEADSPLLDQAYVGYPYNEQIGAFQTQIEQAQLRLSTAGSLELQPSAKRTLLAFLQASMRVHQELQAALQFESGHGYHAAKPLWDQERDGAFQTCLAARKRAETLFGD